MRKTNLYKLSLSLEEHKIVNPNQNVCQNIKSNLRLIHSNKILLRLISLKQL
jgi:hypothetical protein